MKPSPFPNASQRSAPRDVFGQSRVTRRRLLSARAWDRTHRKCVWLSIGLVSMALYGCGQSNRPKTVPVSGTVTFAGKPPSQPGALFFAPREVVEGYPRRGGRALFDTDGTYEATSFEKGDGLVPGTYVVRVESWKMPPSMGRPGVSLVPQGFEAAELKVGVDSPAVQYDLDVSLP